VVYLKRGADNKSFETWTGSDGIAFKTTAAFKTLYTESLESAFSEFNLDDCSKETDLDKRAKCEAVKAGLNQLIAEDYAAACSTKDVSEWVYVNAFGG